MNQIGNYDWEYHHSDTFQARNPEGYDVKKRYVSQVFCPDPKMAAETTDGVFQLVDGYKIYCGIGKIDRSYEKIK